MNEQYDGWLKSSHHAVAVCNDCHTPHDLIGKYSTKALNGFWHSFAFTSGASPTTSRSRRATTHHRAACRSCHSDIVHAIDVSGRARRRGDLSCVAVPRPRRARRARSDAVIHGRARASSHDASHRSARSHWRRYRRLPRRRRHGAGDRRRHGAAREHLRAQAGGAESVLPRRRARPTTRTTRRSGARTSRMQYDGYQRTVDQVRTRYGGSEAVPAHADAGRPALDRGAVEARGGPAAEDACGPATPSRRTSARSAATPTCSTTRRSPSGSRS